MAKSRERTRTTSNGWAMSQPVGLGRVHPGDAGGSVFRQQEQSWANTLGS